MHEAPIIPSEFDTPGSQQFIRFISIAETATNAAEKVTTEDPRYHDVFLNGNVDTKTVDKIMKTLSRNSNDYQVGTVPPEFLMTRYIPSRARLISNY